jgi:hypothetical protein
MRKSKLTEVDDNMCGEKVNTKEYLGVNPFDCTKCGRIFDRIITPEGEKGSCHAIQKLHI